MPASILEAVVAEHRSLQHAVSLRRRMDLTVAAIFAVTLVVLTITSAVSARNEVLHEERHHAEALLDHLTSMPALRSTSAARAEIDHVQPYLVRVGSRLEVAEGKTSSPAGLVIQRPLPGDTETRFLRYTIGAPRIAQLTRSIVARHVAAGLVALVVVLLAIELTLRRRLSGPLKAIKHQLDSLCRYGWFVAVPDVDDELAQLQRAIGDVAPAVSARTTEWIRRESEHETAAVARRIQELMEARVPAAVERIENVTRSGKLSIFSLNEAYAAEEEILGIAAALTELQALLASPHVAHEGHA